MTPTDDAAANQLLEDYRSAGGYGATIHEISSRTSIKPQAIAVLAQWLVELESRWPGSETEGRQSARIALARALGCKESRKTAAVPALISQFDTGKPIGANARWAAGNALYDIPAEPSYFEELAAIARNREFGMERQMVVLWLGKSRRPEAVEVAVSQLDDESVQGHALEALSKLRAQGVRDVVEPFLTSKNKWHRRSAERILRYDES
ncbi:HEAT repeat domain-containing protein [Nocardia takedensis]|uniref:HEAT repeat domain-containing protein n=1 Tax=Nocardia takedensis TaxID=259390 RepID=UPI000303A003|nr:HEAT repeat domain-containing protein [Nocardia takedensis]